MWVFILQIYVEGLLCARHSSRGQRPGSKQNFCLDPSTGEFYILVTSTG